MIAATQTQLVNPGATEISMVIAVPRLKDGLTWRLINDRDGSIAIPESADQITEIDEGHDPGLRRYERPYIAPTAPGRYLAIWRLNNQDETAVTVVVARSTEAAFASLNDVERRLGYTLDDEKSATAQFLLNMSAAVIADAAGYDDGWAASLRPVPQLLRLLSVELVCRSIANPSQYAQITQQVGSYSFQAEQQTVGMTLSDTETLMIRRAVHGRTTDTATVESNFKPAQDEYWLRKQAGRLQDSTGVIP